VVGIALGIAVSLTTDLPLAPEVGLGWAHSLVGSLAAKGTFRWEPSGCGGCCSGSRIGLLQLAREGAVSAVPPTDC